MLGQKGVEPLAMQIFAGIVLLVIGIGIGYAVYSWAGKGTSSLLAFNVTLDGQSSLSVTIARENSRNITVSVETLGGYDKTVSLSYTGQPSGVQVSFAPASGKPTFGSTMTVLVDNSAIAGPSTITVKARGEDDTEKTAILNLTVS